MKELDKEQLEAVRECWAGTMMEKTFLSNLKEKGLIKEEFEVGKWYKATNSQALCFIVSFPNRGIKDECEVYGFDISGDWIGGTNCYGSITNEFVKATDKEVEEALVKEAKKRGFKGNSKLKMFSEYDEQYEVSTEFFFSMDHNVLYMGNPCFSNRTIFKDGKWAEIVEEDQGCSALEEKREIVLDGVTYIEK